MTDPSWKAQFAQRPLVAGSLIGLRSFVVTPDNTLTGCVKTALWHPGVNDASCYAMRAQMASAIWQMNAAMMQSSIRMADLIAALSGKPRPVNLVKKPKPVPPPEPEPHQIAGVGCTCGFYAYFDADANPHHVPDNVLGLIEAFGVATVGSRGFRAEKARIVALVEPDPAMPARSSSGWAFPQCGCAMCTAPVVAPPCDLAAIAANYGNVPVFSTVAAALAEFPLTPVAPPPPGERPERRAPKSRTEPVNETPQARAMRLKRERNTGPARPRLDGRSAR